MNPISLRLVIPDDWPVILGWLKQPHLAASWSPATTIYQELQAHHQEDMRIISHHATPIGIVCWQTPTAAELSEAGLSDLPAGLIDIDIMIGDSEYLYQGHGTRALTLVIEQLWSKGITWIGLATQTSNTPALKSFTKVGCSPFREFVENGQQYVYLTLGSKITTLKR